MILFRNTQLFDPEPQGMVDILIAQNKIIAIDKNIQISGLNVQEIDMQGLIFTPGFIDQHIHLIGAGGKNGFSSMTHELYASEILNVGSTTVVGLLGTDGSTRSIHSLFAKTMSLREQGVNAYMHTGYYGLDPVHVTDCIQNDLIFIEPILGCKIAISDIRSSYPSDQDLLRILRAVRTGGLIARKKGIMHVHLGALKTQMDPLFRLVNDFEFPIEHISPTHVGRTSSLFDQALEFAKLGGSIDITTGASKFKDPHLCVIDAHQKNIDHELLTFSTDGNAGLDKKNEKGEIIGTKPADIGANLKEVVSLIKTGFPIDKALSLVTKNPAKNLGINTKGSVKLQMDADFCIFDSNWNLVNTFTLGKFNHPYEGIQ